MTNDSFRISSDLFGFKFKWKKACMNCPHGPKTQDLMNSNPEFSSYLPMMSHNQFPVESGLRVDNNFKSLFRSGPALVGSPHKILLKSTSKLIYFS